MFRNEDFDNKQIIGAIVILVVLFIAGALVQAFVFPCPAHAFCTI